MSENKEKSSVGAIVGILIFFFIIFFLVAGAVFAMVSGEAQIGEQLGVVEVTGTIESADSTVKSIRQFSEDELIKGVLIRVDSPGGTVSASQEIVEAIRSIKKPVVISMGDMAASGAYYVSCAGPTIYASEGTLTGSIGVISQIVEFRDVIEFMKLKVHTVKTGDLKDAGSPLREFNEADKQYFTELGLEILDQFVSHVAEARNLPKDKVMALADGRVWSGRQAKALGLIDEIGGFNDAIEALKAQAGIQDKVVLVYPKRSSDDLIYSLLQEGASEVSHGIATGAREVLNSPRSFMYLYK
jgi:protease-4